MKTGAKIIFVLFLVVFVGASVWLSFNTIVRPTYEFEEQADIRGTDVDGWAFIGFNGNQNTKEVHIDYVRDENGNNPDKTKPIVSVDSYTFVSDEYVQYIYIGKDVRFIDERAFFYCKQLRAVYVDDENPWFTDVDGVLYTKDMKTILLYPICYCTHLVYTDFANSGEVTNIGLDYQEAFKISGATPDELYADFKSKASDDISRELFDEMLENGVMAPYIGTYYMVAEKNANSVAVKKYWSCDEVYSIPEGVERVGANCFYKCDRLQNIDIPSTVKEIGDMAFFKCYGIKLVNLPDGLTEIGADAFSYCQNMRYSIFIPESVESIGHHAFYESGSIEVFFLEDASEATISLGGNWQPKGGNEFKADPPVFGASYADFEKYNNEKIAAEPPAEEARPKAEPTGAEILADIEDKYANSSIVVVQDDGTNYTVVIILIVVVFVPCTVIVVLEVIRKMFKEDFLMTKKQKEKMKRKREEAEKLQQEYAEQQKQAREAQEGGDE